MSCHSRYLVYLFFIPSDGLLKTGNELPGMITRYTRICLFALLLLQGFIAFAQPHAQAEKLYSIEELKADLLFYKSRLEKIHPNLYLYSTEKEIDHLFDSLSGLVDKPMTDLGFYRILSLSSSVVKDGHTIILPDASTREFHNLNDKFLPYQLAMIDNELYVQYSYTGDKGIPDGVKIKQINGESSREVIDALMRRQVRDGYNLSYAQWILDNYFREYYSYSFGHPDVFEIVFERGGETTKATVPALKKDSISYYKRNNYQSMIADPAPGTGIVLELNRAASYGLLTIKDFHDDILWSQYRQRFDKAVSNSFDSIENSGVKNLIIDLRNNQGGDVENGVYLLSFLLDKPFSVVNGYSCINNGRLEDCRGPSPGMHQPRNINLKGDIYVLINGGSFSNSAIVASCLRTNNRTKFIGTETGGNPNVLAGYAKEFKLPNTKINVEIPTKRFVMTSVEQNSGFGIKPEYVMVPTIEDRIRKVDKQLEFVLKMIKKQK
jgi:hypothetical protein